MPTINEGNNGFHLFTVVTDGYGGLISEDHEGKEIARVVYRDPEGGPDGKAEEEAFLELVRRTLAIMNADA